MRKIIKIKKLINDLPFNLGAASLAVIIGLGEGIFKTFEQMLDRSNFTMGKSIRRTGNLKTFQDYYAEIKKLGDNSLRTALWRLKQKGLIENKEDGLSLTFLGLKYFKTIRDRADLQKKQWDGKWRIIMFDIPEKLRKERGWLRAQLYFLGYKPLQKSVFAGKFPIKEDLYKEISERNLNRCVNLITVGEIDNEEVFN